MTTPIHFWAACAVAVAATALTAPVQAQDLRIEGGSAVLGTDWRGDVAAYGSLKLAARFGEVAGPYLQGHVGYAPVDQRLLTLISLGAQVWLDFDKVWPHARLGFVHQHEESLSVVANDFGSAIFGSGDGIRHRAGGEFGVGADVRVWERREVHLYVTVDGTAKIFPDDLGPLVYASGGLGVGLNYAL